MDRRSFLAAAGLITAHAAAPALADQPDRPAPQSAPAPAPGRVNPFTLDGRWYKAALHVHTTTSDGDVDVPTRLAQYRNLGYSVVAITDHWKTNDLAGRSDPDFLAICGMEAHPRTASGAPAHHFVCLDLPHPFELDRNLPAQKLIDNVLSIGGKLIYAHPYWTAHSIIEMTETTGCIALEVCNAVCHLRWAKGFNNVHWDQALHQGLPFNAIATDDVHSSNEINHAWTMIKAPALTRSDIIAAIASGACYSSCGPTIHDFRLADNTLTIKSSPVAHIRFQFDGAGGGRVYNAPPNATIDTAQWKLPARPPKWIRAEVVDAQNNHAWTNPIFTS